MLALLTLPDGLDAGQYQTPQRPLQQTERSRANLAQGPAEIKIRR